MVNKITKQKIDRHLEYDWYKYILILLAAIGLWALIFSVTSNIPDERRFAITSIGPRFDENVERIFLEDFERAPEEIFGEGSVIEEISFGNFANDGYLGALMQTQGTSLDILIAPEGHFDEYASRLGYFLTFDQIIEEGYFSGAYEDGSFTGDAWKHLEARNAVYKLKAEEQESDDEERKEYLASIRGKPAGIILNNLATDLFFRYGAKQPAEGEVPAEGETPEREVYVLGVVRANLSGSGGGNKGVFNGAKQDKNRTEVFSWFSYIFLDETEPQRYLKYTCVTAVE